MTNSLIAIWLSGTLTAVACTSALVLTFQRVYLHKTQKEDPAPLHFDQNRDLTAPFADTHRLTRVTFGTLVITLLTGLAFYDVVLAQQPGDDMLPIMARCMMFLSWLYATVLALVSRRYRFPNSWGWILNVHLFFFYLTSYCIFIFDLYEAAVYQPDATWKSMLPLVLSFLIDTDLIYTTATVQRGHPFVDEKGKTVIGIDVSSIFSFFFFDWVTPLIEHAFKNKTLSDDDLPTLAPLFRGYNLYYMFGDSRGKPLLKRIFLSNRFAITIQIILAVVTSFGYYVPAYFINQLLQLIQDMGGHGDNESLRQGYLIVAFLGLSICILGLGEGQLWYYASSSLQVRIKAMLNIEIYRKTLRRRDLSIASSNVEDEDEDKDKKKGEEEEEDKKGVEEKGDSTSTTGTIVNLMSTDSNRISEFSTWWFSAIAAPTELTIGIYFLYHLLGKSCLLGLLVMIIVLPFNHYNAKIYAKTQDRLMEARDKRVNLMNEALQGIRQIKFFAWEKNWQKRIMEARNVELHHLGITYISGVLFTLLWEGSPILVTLISFWSFTKLEGNELTAPIAFTAITIFNELRFALNVLPEVFIEWLQCLISIRRIQTYLDEDEIEPAEPLDPTAMENTTIGFKNATIGWSKESYKDNEADQNEEGSKNFILKDLNLEFPKNQLSLISGSTGAGKTLMMLTLLGESVILEGQVSCPRQQVSDIVSCDFSVADKIDSKDWILPYAVAYVSQTSWLQNASIRDNILFGLPYDESRYRETLSVCALNKDLEILEDGDQTEIGEKGITLSGGQKARVSLARAVYSRAQIVLMDDVLSAVDSHTGKHLYQKCLLGPLMENRTRILITHHIKLCSKGSAYIVHIEDGRADIAGSVAELRASGKLSDLLEHEEKEDHKEEEAAAEEKAIEQTLDGEDANKKKDDKKPRVLVEEESKASGMVKLRLYKMYAGMVGNPIFWLIMAALVLGSRGLDIAETWWIKQWTRSYAADEVTVYQQTAWSQPQTSLFSQYKSNIITVNASSSDIISVESKTQHDLDFYMRIYVLITVSNIIVGTGRFAVLYWGALRANKTLYGELLQRVFRAPLRFFDRTPLGRILNRFSKDFETIDSNIPNDVLNFVTEWVTIISSMLTVSFVLPIFLVPMLSVAAVNVVLGIKFVSTSRELKRMDSVSRSPLFSHFTETIVGVATVRAFGVTQLFLQNMLEYIDTNARPYYYTWTVNRHASVRYAITGAVINSLTAFIILLNIEKVDASLAGFCLSFVLLFTHQMFWGIRRYTSLEMSFNAVERVVEFMEMEQEAPAITNLRPPSGWPTKGAIEVHDLEVRYAADLEPVLRKLSFSVRPQEKIGVVGRTGSGKSTLALSFFRFIEASTGSIVIDNVDIKDLGTEDLRSNLTIIPQDPTLFSGSLRSNMDPFDQFKDEDIFTALRRVHLIPSDDGEPASSSTSSSTVDGAGVNANVFKDLDTAVTEGGKNFSQGQRQLLCLARALLKRNRVVLMDEATASVDFETDRAIQKTIATEFSDSTILCIAHRLHTIIDYDRILVLDQGQIVEFDSPLTLITNTESVFHKMCRNSGEYDSLVSLAKEKHQLVETA